MLMQIIKWVVNWYKVQKVYNTYMLECSRGDTRSRGEMRRCYLCREPASVTHFSNTPSCSPNVYFGLGYLLFELLLFFVRYYFIGVDGRGGHGSLVLIG